MVYPTLIKLICWKSMTHTVTAHLGTSQKILGGWEIALHKWRNLTWFLRVNWCVFVWFSIQKIMQKHTHWPSGINAKFSLYYNFISYLFCHFLPHKCHKVMGFHPARVLVFHSPVASIIHDTFLCSTHNDRG